MQPTTAQMRCEGSQQGRWCVSYKSRQNPHCQTDGRNRQSRYRLMRKQLKAAVVLVAFNHDRSSERGGTISEPPHTSPTKARRVWMASKFPQDYRLPIAEIRQERRRFSSGEQALGIIKKIALGPATHSRETHRRHNTGPCSNGRATPR